MAKEMYKVFWTGKIEKVVIDKETHAFFTHSGIREKKHADYYAFFDCLPDCIKWLADRQSSIAEEAYQCHERAIIRYSNAKAERDRLFKLTPEEVKAMVK